MNLRYDGCDANTPCPPPHLTHVTRFF